MHKNRRKRNRFVARQISEEAKVDTCEETSKLFREEEMKIEIDSTIVTFMLIRLRFFAKRVYISRRDIQDVL